MPCPSTMGSAMPLNSTARVISRMSGALRSMLFSISICDDLEGRHWSAAVRSDGHTNRRRPVHVCAARNTVLLSLALAWAEAIGAFDIFLGINAVDFSGYPDCRPAFLEAFQVLADVATRTGLEGQPITIHAPLLVLSKAEIIKLGLELGVRYELTNSCYHPYDNGIPCGACDACRLRRQAFTELGNARSIDAPMTLPNYFGVLSNRDRIKIHGERLPFWRFLDEQPDGWLSSLAYLSRVREIIPAGRHVLWTVAPGATSRPRRRRSATNRSHQHVRGICIRPWHTSTIGSSLPITC